MTEITVITPKGIFEPKVSEQTGKLGPGAVVDINGKRWIVWADQMDKVRGTAGKPIQISYQTKEYMGKPQYTIVGANPMSAPQAMKQHPQYQELPAPKPAAYSPTEKDVDIAVLALAKDVPHWFAEIMPGDTNGVVKLLRCLALAWREYKQPTAAPRPTLQQEMNDEIPF